MGRKSLLVLAAGAAAALLVLGQASPAVPRGTMPIPRETPPPAFAFPDEPPPEPPKRPRVVGTDGPVAALLAFHAWGVPEPQRAETDDAGAFDYPAEDARWVAVRADGYPPQLFEFDRDALELRLKPGKARTLTIADEDGNPGAFADIDVYGDDLLTIPFSTARADGRGVATLLLTGRETVVVRLAGYASALAEEGRVVLKPGYSLAGRVVDTRGVPIPGARVRAGGGGG